MSMRDLPDMHAQSMRAKGRADTGGG